MVLKGGERDADGDIIGQIIPWYDLDEPGESLSAVKRQDSRRCAQRPVDRQSIDKGDYRSTMAHPREPCGFPKLFPSISRRTQEVKVLLENCQRRYTNHE